MLQIRKNLKNLQYKVDSMGVAVEFFVGTDGVLTDLKIIKSQQGVVLDPRAIEALSEPNLWVPGLKYGRPVSSKITIYIDMGTFQYSVINSTKERYFY